MANTKSARKAQRTALRRHVFNTRRKTAMKDSVKEISKLIHAKEAGKAAALLPGFQKAVDKATKNGVIKANAAARIKSRVAKRVRAIAG